MAPRVFAAVDLGASSGRVVAGIVRDQQVELEVVHRFPNGMREVDGHLRWDVTHLFEEVLVGLALLAECHPQVESIGVDTWGVDYGLLDEEGNLLAEPTAYRDTRVDAVIEGVHSRIAPEQLYAINGLQFLPFNTIYQLEAEKRGPLWTRARHVVLLPDLIAYWLTGVLRSEYTNSSTTGLVDARARVWSTTLLERVEVPPDLLAPIEHPGTVRGHLRPELTQRLGLSASTSVTTVGSHDTASAVAAVPAMASGFAYISSGTWSLVGVEIDQPIIDDTARQANFTNEGGVEGRIRFLRNVGGLWLVQESMRTWEAQGEQEDLDQLLAEAAKLPADGPRIDVDDPSFLAPDDMPVRVARAAGSPHRLTPAETIRCIIDSLAVAYATTAGDAASLAGTDLDVIHIVGGGSQNTLLCKLTADAAGVPVTAGPVEATALGNVLVQGSAHGALAGTVDEMRLGIARHLQIRRYEPNGRLR